MSALARELDGLLLALPGVVTLYSTESAVARGARELVSGERSLVEITPGEDAVPTRIAVSLGVDASAQAPVTAATVARAIRSALPEGSSTEIVVRISRVTIAE